MNPWMQQQTPASQVPPFLHFGSLSVPHNANKNQSRLKPFIKNYLQAPVACVPFSLLTDFTEWPCVVRCTLTSPQVACCSGIHAFAVNGITQNWREKAGKTSFYRTQIDKNKTLSDYFHFITYFTQGPSVAFCAFADSEITSSPIFAWIGITQVCN